jgi:hypothetical protein
VADDEFRTTVLQELKKLQDRADRAENLLRDAMRAMGAPLVGDEEFADIERDRCYTVAELATLPGRECSTTAIYRALDLRQLRESLNAGTRGALGRDYIAFLKERGGRRRRTRKARG